ncbi:MAG: hypothetical protein WKF40_04130 [Thermoleophilaceae bacterium]
MFVSPRRTSWMRSDAWWERLPGSAPRVSAHLVWGRRRVGKTALLEEFSGERRTVFHTASRPAGGRRAETAG